MLDLKGLFDLSLRILDFRPASSIQHPLAPSKGVIPLTTRRFEAEPRYELPFYEGTAPGQSSAEHGQADEVPFLYAAVSYRFIKGNGTGCGGYVSVFVQGDVKPFHR